MPDDLTFAWLRQQNLARCNESFRNIDSWTPTDWACAVAGECGELCNLVKKMLRLSSHNEWVAKPEDRRQEDLLRRAAEEMADLVIYVDLLAARLRIDLGPEIQQKFNRTSEEQHSDRRL